jgi:CrcB protein
VTPLVFIALSVAGGVGASLRLLVDGVVKARSRLEFPLATTVINVSGSLLLGFLTGLAAARLVPDAWALVFGAGLLGGYTTFSTASFETVRLVQSRRFRAAAVNGFGMLLGAVAAASLGLWLGSIL